MFVGRAANITAHVLLKTPREKTSTALTLPVRALVPHTTHVANSLFNVLRIVLE
jgi:hypothetical protein